LTAYDLDQTVYAAFGEAVLELSEDLVIQLGARYEDYGDGKDTFDPKLSIQYHVNDNLSLRASVQTTFRAPTPNDLDEGSSTALAFVLPALAFKAVDTTGSPDVDPESAFTYNFGLVWSSDAMTASIDY
jgi:outer membrane receptor protein involved in Fe transport